MSGTVISKSKGFGAGASLPGFAGACSRSIAIVACTGAVCNYARTVDMGDIAYEVQVASGAYLLASHPR